MSAPGFSNLKNSYEEEMFMYISPVDCKPRCLRRQKHFDLMLTLGDIYVDKVDAPNVF